MNKEKTMAMLSMEKSIKQEQSRQNILQSQQQKDVDLR